MTGRKPKLVRKQGSYVISLRVKGHTDSDVLNIRRIKKRRMKRRKRGEGMRMEKLTQHGLAQLAALDKDRMCVI
jgi:hypothetical protein